LKEIHKDERGSINLLVGDTLKNFEEITLFITNEGFARGGCIHRLNNEYCVVLEGKINYFIGDKPEAIYKEGDRVFIPKNTPHYFIAMTDCIVVEWGAAPVEKKERHEKFRQIVDKINRRMKNGIYKSN